MVKASQLVGRMTAKARQMRNDRAIDAAGSRVVACMAETIRSKYFPGVTTALSNRWFS